MTADAVGGVLTYATELTDGLAEHGVEVVLALTGPPPTHEQRRRIAGARFAGYGERGYALEWMDDPWSDLERTAFWLYELVDAVRPDLVHLNGYVHGALRFGVPKVVVGHSCVLSWHEAVRRRPAERRWRRYRAAVTAGICGADALVAPTRAALAELQRLYGPACLCEAIPNGIAPDGFGFASDEEFVLGVGRVWDEAKNLHALERIAPRLSLPVVVAGEGSSLGRVDGARLRRLYERAAVFAEAARYEPFGLAALEAALCGCPLVLGDIATLREVWGDAAVYVDPFDDGALLSALERLLADHQERARLARAARDRALSFSRERMAAAYLDLYERLLTEAEERRQLKAAVA
jgi:glycogen synthase